MRPTPYTYSTSTDGMANNIFIYFAAISSSRQNFPTIFWPTGANRISRARVNSANHWTAAAEKRALTPSHQINYKWLQLFFLKKRRCPGRRANLGSFWYFVYFLSQAAPQTTRLLRPPHHLISFFPTTLCPRWEKTFGCCGNRTHKPMLYCTKASWVLNEIFRL